MINFNFHFLLRFYLEIVVNIQITFFLFFGRKSINKSTMFH